MKLSDLAASSAADAVLDHLDNGYLRIHGERGWLIAELRFGAPAFSNAIDGRALSRPLARVRATLPAPPNPDDVPPPMLATRFVAARADGRTVLEGTIGAPDSDADLILSDPLIQVDADIDVERLAYTQPRS